MPTPSSMARPLVKTRPLTTALAAVHVEPALKGTETMMLVAAVQSVVRVADDVRSR